MFSHHRYLRRLFSNADALLALLDTSSILITGMPLLLYLADFIVAPAGLTFVAQPQFVAPLTAFLLSEGYFIDLDSDDDDHFAALGQDFNDTPVVHILAFGRPADDVWIYLQVPRVAPLHTLLLQCSSLVLNGICNAGFFSLYPWSSLFLRTGFLARRLTGGNFRQQQLDLLASRFTAVDRVKYGTHHNSLLRGPRYLGDAWTWFPGNSARAAAFADLLGQGWFVSERVRLLPTQHWVVNTYIGAYPVNSPMLGHTFLTTSLTKVYLVRLLDQVRATARSEAVPYAPRFFGLDVLSFLEHFYMRRTYDVILEGGVILTSVVFDYSRRVGY